MLIYINTFLVTKKTQKIVFYNKIEYFDLFSDLQASYRKGRASCRKAGPLIWRPRLSQEARLLTGRPGLSQSDLLLVKNTDNNYFFIHFYKPGVAGAVYKQLRD